MAVGILETLRRRRADNQAKGEQTYTALIRKVAAGVKVDIAKLADAADDLALKAEDIDNDVKAIERAEMFERAIQAAEPNLESWRDAGPNLKRVMDENHARLVEARTAKANADAKMMSFAATRQALDKLRAENPRIFAPAD